jgi:hypothetical protein
MHVNYAHTLLCSRVTSQDHFLITTNRAHTYTCLQKHMHSTYKLNRNASMPNSSQAPSHTPYKHTGIQYTHTHTHTHIYIYIYSFFHNHMQTLQDHLNAEIVSGTITCMRDAVDYLTWTYFFRRLLGNPTYYHLHASDTESLSGFLQGIVQRCLDDLQEAG